MCPESQDPQSAGSPPRPSACLFPPLTAEAARLLEGYGLIAAKVLDLKPKHRRELPFSIRRLSHELTDERAQGFAPKYMSDAASLAAYVAFFLPWNLYRLTRLLSGLELDLPDNAVCVDLGSGPLTAVQALWIAKPELRQRKLRFFCLDRAAQPMRVGLNLFRALVGQDTPWRIELVQGAMGARLPARADLLIAANVLNEFSTRTGEGREERMAQSLARQTTENARMLLVEPGTRTGGRLLSALRTELAEEGFMPLAPCTHVAECPMPGTTGKAWCHFQFGVVGAPQWLQRMSEDVGFRRRGVALSFLYTGRGEAARSPADMSGVRMISDVFELTGVGFRAGRYGCAEAGLVIAAGDEHELKRLPSGCLWRPRQQPEEPLRDAKTDAIILPLEPLNEPRRAARPDMREETQKSAREVGGRPRPAYVPKPNKAPGILKVRNMALQAFRAGQSEERETGEGVRKSGHGPQRELAGTTVSKVRDDKFKGGKPFPGKPGPQGRQGKSGDFEASPYAGKSERPRETGPEHRGKFKPKPAFGGPKSNKPFPGKPDFKGRQGRPEDFEASAYAGKTERPREAGPERRGKFKPKPAFGGPKSGKSFSGKPGPKGRQGKPEDFEASPYAGKAERPREAGPERRSEFKPRAAAGHSERGYAPRGQAEGRRFEKRGTGPSGEKPKSFGKGKPHSDQRKPSTQRHGQPAGQKTDKAYGPRDGRPSERGGRAPERESGRPERADRRGAQNTNGRPEQRRDLRPDERKAKSRPDSDERESRERDERKPRGPKRGRGSGKGGR
ncbi:small ribosomal subunit Rsm22 family protein [Desulfocurvibacter africanus]|uniref:Ribosomal small subunit Rsm22 n=2 Tax=Desulfocurvibacter africanus TaxID=873 RepID=F3Z3Y7_DESAF|nr:small ribosomal subunit Rsm22 family protein [Desulfocurvibacter africanus]EGJ50439.1 Ribosomal small subunit Rsm22 [Desulfocurvibacter africanus subsp. africanus str. Walvis Bay]